MGASHVERLRRARELLADRGYDTADTALLCHAGANVEPNPAGSFPRERVITVTLEDLYG
ncbi:hypothetical protein AB0K60_03185 [Thermopolyspora sp. NPDC052614]|uniref:hypothetical protein n=1 Tax=Thermopolyspora sp. NPDC052614 TaxID=3155682 RepID=UPI003429CFEF